MLPREIRLLSEADVLRRWAALQPSEDRGYVRVVDASQYRGVDPNWIEVEIPHGLYAADWNSSAELSPRQVERASEYARWLGPLPPGMAAYDTWRSLQGLRKVVVVDGNHRAHAAHLRGAAVARFYMPVKEWDLFKRSVIAR